MKYALISPEERLKSYARVAEIADTPFEVASPLFWVPCDDEVFASGYGYDEQTQTFVRDVNVPTAQQNKNLATILLKETDWAVLPDVSNPAHSSPYLINVQDFVAFRNQVRPMVLSPVDGVVEFPQVPDAVWSE